MTGTDAASPRPGRLRGWRRGLLGLAVLILLTLAARGLLHAVVDADYLGRRLTGALAASSDSLYRVEIEDVRFSLLRGRFLAENVALRPDSAMLRRRGEAGALPAARYRLTIPELRLDGFSLWGLLWGHHVAFATVHLQAPRLHVEAGRAQDRAEPEARGDTPGDGFHAALARRVPPLRVGRLQVEQAMVSFTQAHGQRSTTTIPGISMWMRNVVVDSAAARDTSRVFFSDDVRVHIAPYRLFSPDSLYVLEMGALRGSSEAASLAVASVRVAPTVSDEAFMRRHRYRTDRYKVATGPVVLADVDYRRLVERQEIAVGALDVDSLLLDVYADRTLPLRPGRPPPVLPHEAFQEIDTRLRLDTIRVKHAEIRYSELAPDGVRPGTISFTNTWGTAYNVTNDPRRMTPARPAVLQARSLLAGAGRLEATIRYELLAPSLSLAYRGTLGRMDARALNGMLVDLEGLRVERGRLDSLWFDVEVEQGVASGALQAIYRDFTVETLDKVTRDRSIKHRLETFIANNMKLASENTAGGGDPPRVALIRQAREEEDPLFKFVWKTLREGLLKTIGLEQ